MEHATNNYPTKDNRSLYLHGSLDARPLLALMEIDENDNRAVDATSARALLGDWVIQRIAAELEELMVSNGMCGSICYERDEWLSTKMVIPRS